VHNLSELDDTSYDDAALSPLLAETLSRSASLHARRRRRTAVLASGALAVVILVATVAIATTRPNHQANGPETARFTSFSLAGALPSQWRVASALDSNTAFSLVCLTDTTCYASSQFTTSDVVQVTNDGGSSWTASRLPETLSDASAVSCAIATECAILGIDAAGSPTFVRTTDGGTTWTTVAGPSGLVGQPATPRTALAPSGLVTLSCPSPGTCFAIASSPSRSDPALGFVTLDGGTTWQRQHVATGFSPVALRCPTSTSCVVTGFFQAPLDGSTQPVGAVLYTHDGGASWRLATLADAVDARSTLSCASAMSCTATFFDSSDSASAVLRTTDGGATWSTSTRLDGQLATGLSCPSPSVCTEGGDKMASNELKGATVAATSDGGTSFEPATLPPNTLALLSLSCPDTSSCFALAVEWSGAVDSPGTFELLASH
jgi:photosystem II stability/assembly factor-like uncharacterized protein